MGFFSRWFGSRDRTPDRPLSDRLFAAAHDPAELERLCRRHRDEILQQCDSWMVVPEALRDKPALAEDYIQRMMRIALVFEQHLGEPRLMQRLRGTPEDNPITRWAEQLEAARRLKDDLPSG